MPHTTHTRTASHLILKKNDSILLQRRFQTGWMDGMYALPAGHLEKGESFIQALLREVSEEIGINLDQKYISVAHVLHRKDTNGDQYVATFFLCEQWDGEPVNCEPEWCDDLSWFPLGNLPDNITPATKIVLERIGENHFFSEIGWDPSITL